ncbi:hemolysin [Candidatus Methanomassiliicoccus intestinalis]|jgi:hemolysins and related proteins containing CBS domains|uniref:Hemolysin-related protein containing CBS domains n=1 Tax=Methanomassiliicoccus intestinalis (strain Issoire-Mx1) TaxID=1295009 RepID=R9T6Q4_METII|nr:hemolysin family protein [Candidatus Methanomassiliicoccus intestinalis]AGN26410.1 Hemolysin-related protein containing CBS domains [Candidatus Methanomassiliicoccus intestinalis Issoire-Mx1]TQS82430.1 MAG: hemolysin [Candidatus Methanomassiliicoccus intestinalis]
MDESSVMMVIILIILVGLSAYFSASETAFSSVNKIRLKNYAKEGNKKAEKALSLAENFDKSITTILIGNNLVNIAATSLCTLLFTLEFGAVGVGYSTIVMTIALLVFGEITPKCIAKENAESFAIAVTSSLNILIKVFTPVSYLFIKLKSLITKSMKNKEVPTLTEEELMVMIDEIEEEGTLEKRESELIKSAIEFDNITVDEVLIPRVDIAAADIRSDRYEMKYIFTSTGYSRIPVYEDNIDNIIGVVYEKDFYTKYFDSETVLLTDIVRPIQFVPETMKISTLLTDLQKSKTHMAVVLDSYGGTLGIVTLEDILEELVGEIWDESDEIEYSVIKESEDRYSVLGGANIYDVMEEIGLDFDPGEYEDHTVGGYIQYVLEKIPLKGDKVELPNATLIVKSIKKRRIREILIIKKPLLDNVEPE